MENTKVVCAWCGLHMKGEKTARQVSHSCCPACEKKENEKLDRDAKPSVPCNCGELENLHIRLYGKFGNEFAKCIPMTPAYFSAIARAFNSYDELVFVLRHAQAELKGEGELLKSVVLDLIRKALANTEDK